MALPHPQSGKDNHRNKDKAEHADVLLNFRRRTINVAQDRKAKDDVNPAKNQSFGGISHHRALFHRGSASYIFQPSTRGSWIAWLPRNAGGILVGVPASVRRRQFSKRAVHRTWFEVLRGW